MAGQAGTVPDTKSCHFLSGKYEDSQGKDPFSAIVAAFSEFVEILVKGDANESERIKSKIQKATGDEVTVLLDVLPSLEPRIGKQATQSYIITAWQRISASSIV